MSSAKFQPFWSMCYKRCGREICSPTQSISVLANTEDHLFRSVLAIGYWPLSIHHFSCSIQGGSAIQMETYSALLVFCEGNSPVHRSPFNSHHKGHWRGALMFSLICAWTNGWANHRDAGDVRRHRAHYDVTLMGTSRSPSLCVGRLCYYAHCYHSFVWCNYLSRPLIPASGKQVPN